MEVTTFPSNTEVDNLAVTIGRIEMVNTLTDDKGGVVEGSVLVDIPISKESKKIISTGGRKTWKRNNRAAAKKSTIKSIPSSEQLKKRKIVGKCLTLDAKKVCDVDQEITDGTTHCLAGVGNDQPYRSL